MTISIGDSVAFEYTARLADGPVFDTTRESVAAETGLAERQPDREYEPFTVEVGSGEIIAGVDEALVGMASDEEATIEVPTEKGYGEPTDERVREHDAADFREMLEVDEVTEGMEIQTEGGEIGSVVHAGPDTVRVDFNHDLAGEDLEFEIEIVDVQ